MKKTLALLIVTMAGIAGAATTYTADNPVEIMASPYPGAVELYLTEDFVDSCGDADQLILFEMGTELTGVATAENFLAVYDKSTDTITMSWHELETEENTNQSSATYSLSDFYNPITNEYYISLMFGGSWMPGLMPNNPLITIYVWNQDDSAYDGNIVSVFDYPSGIMLDSITTEIDPMYIKQVYLNESGASVMESVPEPTTATLSLLALAGVSARRRRK